jgi:hypothetical protein
LFLKTQIFCHPRAAHCPNAGWTASSNSPAAQPSWSSLAVVPITPNPQVNNRCPLARTTVFVWWWVRTWVQFPANKYLLTPVKPLRKVAERYLQLPPISRQPQLSATFRSFLSVKRRISTRSGIRKTRFGCQKPAVAGQVDRRVRQHSHYAAFALARKEMQ